MTEIKFIKDGNIFDSKMETLINPVNCIGVMGKGLAQQFKKLYPKMMQDYKLRCSKNKVIIGRPYIYETTHHIKPDINIKILNFPTKTDWRFSSKLEYIEDGMIYLCSKIEEWQVKSLALPGLGCGCGGLEWENVRHIIVKYLNKISDNIIVEIYEPKKETNNKYSNVHKQQCKNKKKRPLNTTDFFADIENKTPLRKKSKKTL